MGTQIKDFVKKYIIHLCIAVLLPLILETLPKIADTTKEYFTGDPTPTFQEWWAVVKPMIYGMFAALFYAILPFKAKKS